jgi:hypothetical protein
MSRKKINKLPFRNYRIINDLELTNRQIGENIAIVERIDMLWERVRAERDKLGRGGNKIIASRLGKAEGWVSRKLNRKREITLQDFLSICDALQGHRRGQAQPGHRQARILRLPPRLMSDGPIIETFDPGICRKSFKS